MGWDVCIPLPLPAMLPALGGRRQEQEDPKEVASLAEGQCDGKLHQ